MLPAGRRAIIERKSWPVPAIFGLIRKVGAVAQSEMDSTFNNGIGMIFVVGNKQADGVIRTLKTMGEKSFVIGEIRKGARGVTLRG